MADKTKIEWTDATWNPITGCSVVSAGCTNCYAMKLAGTRLKHTPSRQGLTDMTKAKNGKSHPVWNGQIRFNEAEWLKPLSWRKPRDIFVCAHGDLFHPSVTDDMIDRVMAVIALTPQHTYQVLTKRDERMKAYISDPTRPYRLARVMVDVFILNAETANQKTYGRLINAHWPVESLGDIDMPDDILVNPWPLPNVWLGVSVEDQKTADLRIPILLDTPAAIRFISAEPLLGPLDIRNYVARKATFANAVDRASDHLMCTTEEAEAAKARYTRLNWVIVGGESGPGARPMHPDWARQLRDQCAAAGVAFFFKQWGNWTPHEIGQDGNLKPPLPISAMATLSTLRRWTPETLTSYPAEKNIAAQDFFAPGVISAKTTKVFAGRWLDGRLHDAMPLREAHL